MTKTQKAWNVFAIIALIIVSSVGGLILYAKSFYDNLKFDFGLDKSKIQLNNLTGILANIIANKSINVPIIFFVTNDNDKELKLKQVSLSINYQNTEVLKTVKEISEIIVPANTKNYPTPVNILVLLNLESIKLISELIKKNKPEVEITPTGKLFFIKKSVTFKQNLEI